MVLKALLILPVFGIMILAFGTQLVEIAQSASDKTLSYAGDMENAMDCAMHGVPLEECSPELFSYDFTPEINSTFNVTHAFLDDYAELLEEAVYEINETGNTTVIIIYLD